MKRWRGRAASNRPDDGGDEHSRHRRNRRLRQFTSTHDGSFGISGTSDKDKGSDLWNMIEEEADRLWRDDGGRNADVSTSRTGAQRRWGALVGLVKKGAGRASGSGSPGPVKAPHPKYQGLFTVRLEDLLAGPAAEARAELIGSGPVPPKMLWRMLCDASLVPMVTGADGQPLWMGCETRTATVAQWKALIVRDKACVICGAAPSRCEAHHIEFWEFNGPTGITNLVLLCTHHHHLLHDHGLELVTSDGTMKLKPRGRPRRHDSEIYRATADPPDDLGLFS